MSDKMKLMLEAIPDGEDINIDEVEQIASATGANDYRQIVGCIIYLRKRELEKVSRYEAFKAAFPQRCIVSETEAGGYETDRKVGEPLTKTTVNVKAKRLETSNLYKTIHSLLSTSLYVAYAVERLKVLDEVLDIALDPHTPLRDKDRYMKIFLDETRKPQEAKGLEVNFNVQANNVNVVSIEEKMSSIARAMNHASATEVLNMIDAGKVNNGNSTED